MATEVGRAYVTLEARVKDLETGLHRANAQVEAFARQTDQKTRQTSSKFAAMGQTMAAVGRKMTMRVTLPIVGLGVAAFKMSADFEKSMAKIQGLVGIQADQVKKMGTDVKRMAAQYGKSASEAADAMFFITSAGLRGAEANDVLAASLKASVAGLGEAKTVADLMTSAVNAYGSANITAAQAGDALTAAVREGKLEAADLAGSMGRVLPVGSALGVEFNELGGIFAALSRTGTGAAEASTQIRGILFSLLKPTKQAQEALGEMGTSAGELRKSIRERGLFATLEDLTNAMGDNEEMQGRVFNNVRALSGVMDLFGANVETSRGIMRRTADATGMLDAAYNAVADTASFKLQKAFNQIKIALMEFGAMMAPTIAKIAQFVQRLTSAFTSLPGPVKQAMAAFAALAAVMGPLLWIGGKLIVTFSKMGRVLPGLAGAGAALGGLGGAAGGTTGKVGLLGRILPVLGMAGPMGAAVAGVGLGIAALFAFRNTTDANERALDGLTKQTEAFTQEVGRINEVYAQANTATDNSRKANEEAAKASDANTRAQLAYISALTAGQGPNETEAQYLRRLSDLRLKAAQANAAGVTASNNSAAAARNAASSALAVADASSKEVDAGRRRIDGLTKQSQGLAILGKDSAAYRANQAELSKATAEQTVREAQRVNKLREAAGAQKAAIKTVTDSAMSDKEKGAQLDLLNRRLNKTRGELREAEGAFKSLDKQHAKPKVTADTKDARNEIDLVKRGLAGIDRLVTVTIQAVKKGTGFSGSARGGFRGGFAGFAGGGMVRGPGGRDVIPAMLTRGEAVLTKQQQSMVDRGMTVRDAIRRTGGAYNKGAQTGGKKLTPEQKKKQKREQRVKKRKREKRVSGLQESFTRFSDLFQTAGLARFDENAGKRLKAIEGRFAKTFAGIDTRLSGDLRTIESGFTGTFHAIDTFGNKIHPGLEGGFKAFEKAARATFRAFEKEQRKAQLALNAKHDALTSAEAQLKALQDASSMEDLQANLAEAQKELAEVRQFGGSPEEVAAAQKKVREAERAMLVSELQKTAEAQRTAREEERQAAQDDFNKQWEERRAALQHTINEEQQMLRDQLDKKMEDRRQKAEVERANAQQEMNDEIAQQQTKDAMDRVRRAHELRNIGQHFMRRRGMVKGNLTAINRIVNRAADQLEISGKNVGEALASGLVQAEKVVRARASKLATIINNYLRTASPTKKGPMSDLDKWWDGFAPALLEGMDTSMIEGAVAMATSPGRIKAGGGFGAGAVVINLTVTDNTLAGMSRDQADRVASQIKASLDRQIRVSI